LFILVQSAVAAEITKDDLKDLEARLREDIQKMEARLREDIRNSLRGMVLKLCTKNMEDL
jgi:hypothetical protein